MSATGISADDVIRNNENVVANNVIKKNSCALKKPMYIANAKYESSRCSLSAFVNTNDAYSAGALIPIQWVHYISLVLHLPTQF